ncbi:MAG: HNH endonuclease [Planctomycetota bacterium]|nr:MAG: HNH endonuclease [Planctomycetota bacterium]
MKEFVFCTSCNEVHRFGRCPKREARKRERLRKLAARKLRRRRRRDPRPGASQRGYDKDWFALRTKYLKKHPWCEVCGKRADLVHHIVPVSEAPERRLDESNLQSVCRSCHGKIHRRTA